MAKTNDIANQDFASVFSIIERYRTQALRTINYASILTAWEVGAFVAEKIKTATWGDKVVQQLAEYIHTHDPSLRGWSKVTIYRMVKFYETYSCNAFVTLSNNITKDANLSRQIVSATMTPLSNPNELPKPTQQIVSATMTQIPPILLQIGWTNHQIILQNCQIPEQQAFYILYAKHENLNNRELLRIIKTDTYSRMLTDRKMLSEKLKLTYPAAQVLLKDTAMLDMLGLPRRYKENRLRRGIVQHIKDFILDMGKDFLFVDEEHPLEVGGKTFRCDLLFYHRALQCMIAIELKTTEFDPRDLGQLEFYLEALDQNEKRSNENPSIGILMCREANPEVVRYALNRSMSPTMVARYKEQLQVGSVLQRSLEEFTDFLAKQK